MNLNIGDKIRACLYKDAPIELYHILHIFEHKNTKNYVLTRYSYVKKRWIYIVEWDYKIESYVKAGMYKIIKNK